MRASRVRGSGEEETKGFSSVDAAAAAAASDATTAGSCCAAGAAAVIQRWRPREATTQPARSARAHSVGRDPGCSITLLPHPIGSSVMLDKKQVSFSWCLKKCLFSPVTRSVCSVNCVQPLHQSDMLIITDSTKSKIVTNCLPTDVYESL